MMTNSLCMVRVGEFEHLGLNPCLPSPSLPMGLTVTLPKEALEGSRAIERSMGTVRYSCYRPARPHRRRCASHARRRMHATSKLRQQEVEEEIQTRHLQLRGDTGLETGWDVGRACGGVTIAQGQHDVEISNRSTFIDSVVAEIECFGRLSHVPCTEYSKA